MPKKILFLLKRKNNYDDQKDNHIGLSTGLYNSAAFMNDMLNNSGVESHISVVIDNNCIDKEITKHKPTHVIIEALWVVPSKFFVLCKLHPNVKWIIRLHSDIPFLANEGMALDWLGDYVEYKNVFIGTNSPRATEDVRYFIKIKTGWKEKIVKQKVVYLPNFYPQDYKKKILNKDKETIDISCFGAVRPMKNHLIQAMAAIKFAESIGKKLRFHINSGRVEQKGDSVLNNLRSLFSHLSGSGHELVNHEWMNREDFLNLCSKMDIGMQVSFSETFNIVAADLISQGVPVISSPELPWICKMFTSKPTESEDIVDGLKFTYDNPKINLFTNQFLLKRYTNKTRKIWLKHFKTKH